MSTQHPTHERSTAFSSPAIRGELSERQKAVAHRTETNKPGDHAAAEVGVFCPRIPQSLTEAGVTERELDALILKVLLMEGAMLGRSIAQRVALPFGVIEETLHRLKHELLVVFKAGGPLGDYLYDLTEGGAAKARQHAASSSYCGAAPVPLDAYVDSVRRQSMRTQRLRLGDIRRAMADLVLDDALLQRLGEAMNSGLGFMLSGAAGNGKTSIAERVTQAYGATIWIPRSLLVYGEVIRLYDPRQHDLADDAESDPAVETDARWVRIRRPTIVAGGELTMDSFEIDKNAATGVCEAPLQMKSNCGTLVIDDFGRQRVSPEEILNRWIVPLERRIDFLNLAGGRKFEIPLDQLVIFATNLAPRELADEAFLRRIPFKISVPDPSEEQFLETFRRAAASLSIAADESALHYLLDEHFRRPGRVRRFCHPRALAEQIYNYCDFRGLPGGATREAIDAAVANYFGIS